MSLTTGDKTFIQKSITKAIKPIVKKLDQHDQRFGKMDQRQNNFQKSLSFMNTRIQNVEDKLEESDKKNQQHRNDILTAIDAVFKEVKDTREEMTMITHRVYNNHESRIKIIEQHLSIATV